MPNKVVIVTTLPNLAVKSQMGDDVWEARVGLTRLVLQSYIRNGQNVIALTDSELRDDFTMPGLCLVNAPPDKAAGPGRRLVHVYGAEDVGKDGVVDWVESEKLLTPNQIKAINAPIFDGRASAVIPGRRNLNNYPRFQQGFELFISEMCSLYIGYNADYCFGPKAWSSEFVHKFVLPYPTGQEGLPDMHDSIICPAMDGIRAGETLASVTIAWSYPARQRDAEQADFKLPLRRARTLSMLTEAVYSRFKWHEKMAQKA